MFKNVSSQKLTVFAFDATTNLPASGDAANITAYVNKDDAGINALGDTSATEINSTNAKGYYTFDLTQSETNGDKLHFTAKSSTSDIVVLAVPAVVYTLPANLTSATLGNLDAAVSTRSTYAGGAVASVTGAVGSVTGAVGSVIGNVGGNVGGNVTGSVGSVVGAVGSVTGAVGSVTGHTPQTGDAFARLGAPAGASVSADLAAVKVDTGNLVSRITSTLFSGITSLAQWLGLLGGKQTGNSTARTELRATGAGSGTFDETTDSLEAVRDRGDAAWVTGEGGGGGEGTITFPNGTVSVATSPTQFTATGANLLAVTGAYNGMFVRFNEDASGGNVKGERRLCRTHTVSGSNHTFAFASSQAFTAAPAVGAEFVVG